MSDAQTWTLIVGFLTTTVALLGIITTSFNRNLRSEIGRVEARIDGLAAEMRTEFRHLDRDVQALTRHVFGQPE